MCRIRIKALTRGNAVTTTTAFLMNHLMSNQSSTLSPWSMRRCRYEEEYCDARMMPSALPNNDPRIEALTEHITVLAKEIQRLKRFIIVDEQARTVLIHGANLQVVNNIDPTVDPNGLGNLVVGHNVPRKCSQPSDRIGSHNVIIGDLHHYTGCHSLVCGTKNELRANRCVLSGFRNVAHGEYSAILSGCYNTSYGWTSSMLGLYGITSYEKRCVLVGAPQHSKEETDNDEVSLDE